MDKNVEIVTKNKEITDSINYGSPRAFNEYRFKNITELREEKLNLLLDDC